MQTRITILAGLAFAAAFLFLRAVPARASAEQTKPAVVVIQSLKYSEIYDSLSFPARVVPVVNTSVLSETDGVVTQVYAPLGKKVGKRDRILTVKHTDPVYQYAPVQVIAPVTGVISQLEVSPGSQVTKGQKLAVVTDPTRVRVTMEVPALDLGSLHEGMNGEFKFSGKEEWAPVRVSGISPFVDPATGTALCELEVLSTKVGPAQLIPPGTLGQVSFKLNLRQGLSIPEYALNYKGTEPFVRIVNEGKAKTVMVKLGKKHRGRVEILDGLSENAKLIERTARYLSEGDDVIVETSTTQL
jgi:multidrug efflux pump subunit AcrA (membrane-fusion protein)